MSNFATGFAGFVNNLLIAAVLIPVVTLWLVAVGFAGAFVHPLVGVGLFAIPAIGVAKYAGWF